MQFLNEPTKWGKKQIFQLTCYIQSHSLFNSKHILVSMPTVPIINCCNESPQWSTIVASHKRTLCRTPNSKRKSTMKNSTVKLLHGISFNSISRDSFHRNFCIRFLQKFHTNWSSMLCMNCAKISRGDSAIAMSRLRFLRAMLSLKNAIFCLLFDKTRYNY